jgi:transcriptional regulator of acetoin/glycerol metabolism
VQLVLGRRPHRAAAADILPLKDVECAYLRSALARCGGNRSVAAKRLGISRNTLMRRLRDCEAQGSRAA